MLQRLEGKNAIITGASSGIGRAIAQAFLREGADLLVTAKENTDALDTLREEAKAAGRRLHAIRLACEHPSAVDELFTTAVSTLGHIDILVNNAAFASRSPFLETSFAEYEAIQAANARFPFFAVQRFANLIKERKSGGSVINIASVSGYRATSKMSAYQSSKAALIMFTKSASVELAPHGIRVNTISPGLTETRANSPQWRDAPEVWAERSKNIPLGRAGRPSDFGGAAVLLASDEAAWITGANIVIDGGLSAH